MRVALIGTGKMGRAIARVAVTRGHQVVAELGRGDNPGGSGITPERLGHPDVVFEFTTPDAAPANLLALARHRLPTVTGTTGWTDRLPEIAQAVERAGGALLHAANFSIGLHLFLTAARCLADAARTRPEFDAAIVETHHTAKRDAPSGTALRLQSALHDADPSRAFPITSLRLGAVPGTHRLAYDGPFESVDLVHTVRDRAVFADGAVRAGEWLQGGGEGRRRGVFTFDDMLRGGTP